jgi:hypothetical protein
MRSKLEVGPPEGGMQQGVLLAHRCLGEAPL